MRERANPDFCKHDWRLVQDYEGDPYVINGIHYFQYLQCRICGMESYDIKDIAEYQENLPYDDYDLE